MSEYKEYRESLESFVEEQMIGPGGCAFQFGIDEDEYDLKQNEVLTTTPGQIYSSAIIFPSDKSTDDAGNAGQVPDNPHMPNVALQDHDEDNNDDDGDPTNIYDQDDNGALTSTSRRYPTSMGISCCVNRLEDIQQLSITISGRYYTEIPRQDYPRVYIVVSPEDVTGLNALIERYDRDYNLHDSFRLDSDNRKLYSTSGYDPRNFRAIERAEAQRIAGTDSLYNNYTLDIYKGILYDRIIHGNELEQISLELNESKDNLIALAKEKITNIENSQRYIFYLKDISLLYNNNIYGFWRAIPFRTNLDLSSFDFQDSSPKHIYKPNDYACLHNIVDNGTSSLSVWIQTTKNVRDPQDNRVYFRVQLVNNGEFHAHGNDHFSPNIGAVNKLCFFGNKIEITSNTDAISQYNEQTYSLFDTEKNDLNDLYRKKTCYAAGHVCSVDWRIEGNSICIFSEFMPSTEIPDVSPQPKDPSTGESLITDANCLDMKFLSTFNDNSDEDIQNTLLEFANYYDNWLKRQRKLVGNDDGDPEIENNRLDKCVQDLNRLRQNITEFLAPRKSTMRYFRLMNSAMYVQWWHKSDDNRKIANDSLINEISLDDAFYRAKQEHYSWRPFQLAFILLNLDGIFHSKTDTDWNRRNKEADLVWFPTGGGKTEAYLGLIALSIINRRKALTEDDGVAVIMRYTLRLLTTQQFQRALQLISALEQLRKIGLAGNSIYNLGNTQISIGVFSGKASLPNSIAGNDDDSLNYLGEAFNRNPNSSKLPVDRCPICGGNLRYYPGGKFKCQTLHCSFGDDMGLPVKLCDELLYREPPTLLFGTVDKFAQLAFKVNRTDSGDSRRLFGIRATRNSRANTETIHRVAPPSLIIQDELHLLSGPLGSSVGLFENIINSLCTDSDGNKPKIITSTATMRNADFQIQAIYNRKLNVFPHNGVYSHDSFFAYETESKRKYVGILPTGRTQMTTQLMLASAILVHRAVYEDKFKEESYFNAVQDAYYTSISYFNSIKEVGRTSAQFDIEVKKYASRVFRRVLRPHSMLESHYLPTYGYEKEELTGRADAGTVVQTLDALKRNWRADHRDAHIENNCFIRGEKYIDFVLATNMISVGIDVTRLNIMIINSMPRNVAEYIQASSRVGRKDYGLVYTLFSPSRIRDLSYYENFKQFHDKMYSYVEPLSVTPFSDNCIENYLPLALAAYVRQKFTDLSYNDSAATIDDILIATIKKDFIGIFNEIYNNCTGSNNKRIKHILNSLDSINVKTDNLLRDWSNLSQQNRRNLVYSRTQGIPQDTPELFCSPDGLIPGHWVVANNLRNVEANSVIEADEN